MEYKISNKLKIVSIILMVLGALGIGYGFWSAHEVNEGNITEFLANEASHGGHDDAHAVESHGDETAVEAHGDSHGESASHVEENHGDEAKGHEMSHEEHVLHQIQNRPWSALYVAAFFFFMISLGVLAFYAIQYAAQAGWSPVLFRVMEGITAYFYQVDFYCFTNCIFC